MASGFPLSEPGCSVAGRLLSQCGSSSGAATALGRRFYRAIDVPQGSSTWQLSSGGISAEVNVVRKPAGSAERADILGGWRMFAREVGLQTNDDINIKWEGGRSLVLTNLGQTGKPSLSRTLRAKKRAKGPATPALAPESAPESGGVKSGGVKKATAAAKPARRARAATKRQPRGTPRSEAAVEPAQVEPEEQEGVGWCTIM